MTREILKDLLPIMQAFVDGKRIEYSCDGEDWIETENPSWDTDYVYRIKPEPKYRPFKSHKECWDEMHKHPDFGWIKEKDTGNFVNIGYINRQLNKSPIITLTTAVDYEYSSLEVFNYYTFTDNTPFGIKEE